jgi:uncharacterized FlaG/YvyC family protein
LERTLDVFFLKRALKGGRGAPPFRFFIFWQDGTRRCPMMSIQTIQRGGQLPAMDGRTREEKISKSREWTPGGAIPRKQEHSRGVSETADMMDRKIQFSVNKDLDRVVVKIVDPATNTVVKEIPSQDIQKLQLRMKEAMGLLVDEEF